LFQPGYRHARVLSTPIAHPQVSTSMT
jgi:hypothetical protein